MSPPSQYQARRLLELVSYNKARISERDHVDPDVWARTYPPVRGLNFRDRATAQYCLRAGGLGAVPATPEQLPDVETRPLPTVPSNSQQDMQRVESNQSKLTNISSVPSFGKIREPLSTDSNSLDSHPIRPAPVTEYEEFGSEALITQVQDEIDEEFDDSTPSRLFSEIGPSVSVAKGIDGKPPKRSTQYETAEMPFDHQPREANFYSHDDTESEEKSLSSAPKTATTLLSTTTSLPPPPSAPLPAYALEPQKHSENNAYTTQAQHAGLLPVSLRPPPPPPPLFSIENYGATSTVPPPPSFPPPTINDKRARADTDDSSPVTEGESYDYKRQVHDEFSDLGDSETCLKRPWYHDYARNGSAVEKGEEEEEDSLEAEEVDSLEEREYERELGAVPVNTSIVRRRREGLVG